jgi:hypothetical protein
MPVSQIEFCTDDPVYVLVVLVLGITTLVIAWLTGHGASQVIGKFRNPESGWRFAALRAIVVAVPVIVSVAAMLALIGLVQEELEDARGCIQRHQRWLGHHAASFTLDTYTHLLDDGLGDGLDLDAELALDPVRPSGFARQAQGEGPASLYA